LAGVILLAPGIGRAQRRDKIYRIGWMREGAVPVNHTFFDAMQQLGWTAGKDYVVEARYAKASNELPSLAKELLAQNLDVLMTDGTPATRAAKQATSSVPIVFSIGADPVNVGLVDELEQAGANLTGFTFGSYNAKQLEMLKAAIPRATRVAYPERTIPPELLKAASELGLQIQAIPVDGVDGLDAFFRVRTQREDRRCPLSQFVVDRRA
jgi:putative ABC transport system substrate-binding protein